MFSEFLGKDINLSTTDPNIDSVKAAQFNNSLEFSRSLILQIIIKCATEHAFRFRIFSVNHELIEKISNLSTHRSKLLNLWISKFYKAILKGKDEMFY